MSEQNTSTKTTYRVRNWSAYNKSLIQRGSINVWIDEDILCSWQPDPDAPRKRGGQVLYTDIAITCLLTIRSVFHLPLRATQGFAHSLFGLMSLDLPIPNYSTLSRRAAGLVVALPKKISADDSIHLVVDSTGVKIYGEGEWKVRQHGYSKRRTWRKLHLAVDAESSEIQAAILSEANLDDAEVVDDLLEDVEASVEQFSGDGAFDKRKVYDACATKGVKKVTIPPRNDACFWEDDPTVEPHPRNENLRRIQQVGRDEWKKESGYHQRSLSETAVFRFKTIFGNTLSSRKLKQQTTEAMVKCAALNRMTHLGMPDSYAVVG